jgi:hypothetical protein
MRRISWVAEELLTVSTRLLLHEFLVCFFGAGKYRRRYSGKTWVDPAYSRNECQGYLLEVKAAGA